MKGPSKWTPKVIEIYKNNLSGKHQSIKNKVLYKLSYNSRLSDPGFDLDFAPNTDQFMASPPVKFQFFSRAISIFAPDKCVLGWLKIDRGGCT